MRYVQNGHRDARGNYRPYLLYGQSRQVFCLQSFLKKYVNRYANIWDQILPEIFIRYALGPEPRVPHNKIVEVGNHNYKFPDYKALLGAGNRKVFDCLNLYTETQLDGILNRLENVLLEPFCHRQVSDNYSSSVSQTVEGFKYSNLITPLSHHYPSTFNQQPRNLC